VVALRIDVDVEVADRLVGAEQRADARTRRSSAMARNSSQVMSEALTAAVRMPALASASCRPSSATVAISSERVKPSPAIAPPPATAAQPTGGRSRPPLARVTSSAVPT
jgi:cell division septation protein DedD